MAVDLFEAEQVRAHTLLKDPIYRKWFAKVPYLPKSARGGQPWYLYLQRGQDGRWSRAGLTTYAAAYKWVVNHHGEVHDFAIVSKRKSYLPPIYRPKVEINGKMEPARKKVYWTNYPSNHNWCPYCRRPTIFREFTKHHAINPVHKSMGLFSMGPQIRCTICGIRQEGVKEWMNLGR